MKAFNVIITTIGRPDLQRMLDSICPQLEDSDYITIIWDGGNPNDFRIETKATKISIVNDHPLGHWGHGSRTKWQMYLPGDYFINADDDDAFTSDAMLEIRKNCTEDKLYVFKMRLNGSTELPAEHVIAFANIGTPCGVYKPYDLPEWTSEYGGDFKFYKALSNTRDTVFIDHVIYNVRP